MRRLLFAIPLVFGLAWGESQQPPFEEKNWETNENMRNIFLELDTLRTQSAATAASATNIGMKNRLINGDMRIDQRNAGAAGTATSGATTYVIDRWYGYQTGANVTHQRVSSGMTEFPYALRVTGAVGNTRVEIAQRIEAVNVEDLAGQNVTFSIYLAASAGGSITWVAYIPSATDNYAAGAIHHTGTFTVTSSTTRYTASFTLSTAAVRGLLIYVADTDGLGSGETLSATGAQLESGSSATTFERQSFGTELALCQRYYQKSYALGTVPGTATTTAALSYIFPYADLESPVFFKVTMRAAPTITFYNPNSGATGSWRASAPVDRNMTTVTIGDWGFCWQNLNSVTVGNRVQGHWTAAIEL